MGQTATEKCIFTVITACLLARSLLEAVQLVWVHGHCYIRIGPIVGLLRYGKAPARGLQVARRQQLPGQPPEQRHWRYMCVEEARCTGDVA